MVTIECEFVNSIPPNGHNRLPDNKKQLFGGFWWHVPAHTKHVNMAVPMPVDFPKHVHSLSVLVTMVGYPVGGFISL